MGGVEVWERRGYADLVLGGTVLYARIELNCARMRLWCRAQREANAKWALFYDGESLVTGLGGPTHKKLPCDCKIILFRKSLVYNLGDGRRLARGF